MNNFKDVFDNKKPFIGFITAGDPTLTKTELFIDKMIEAGVSLIEIGIPFSDPTAEGPTIEKASLRALKNEVNLNEIFKMVKNIRTKHKTFPLAFMTYLNPVYNYGYEEFFNECKNLDVCGVIIPDLPYEEKNEVSDVANKFNIDVISLVAPTSKNRIEMISRDSTGFIYLVSSLGVTGMRSSITTNLKEIVQDIKKHTNIPVAVGFGIKDELQAKEIASISDGVIVGSAIVSIIEEFGEEAGDHILNYCKKMVEAIR